MSLSREAFFLIRPLFHDRQKEGPYKRGDYCNYSELRLLLLIFSAVFCCFFSKYTLERLKCCRNPLMLIKSQISKIMLPSIYVKFYKNQSSKLVPYDILLGAIFLNISAITLYYVTLISISLHSTFHIN